MEKILICCVVYNQDLFKTNTYQSLLKNEDDVFIYDNSEKSLTSKSQLPQNWIYKTTGKNEGLSKAYNIAVEYANKNKYKWILFTDQDTLFSKNAFKIYEKSIKQYPKDNLFCPIVFMNKRKVMSPLKNIKYLWYKDGHIKPGDLIDLSNFSVINSGMMVNVNTFIAAGGYNESVFLDFSDFQFLEKLSEICQNGRVIDVECSQSFSNQEQSKVQKINRFRLFCLSIKNFKCKKKRNRIWIHLAVIKRALSICMTSKSTKPLSILVNTYFR